MFFSCLKDHSTKKLGSWAKKCVLQPANGRTDGQTDTHESVKSVKMQISKNKNMCIFLMSQVSLNSKIRFLSQKVCPVARSQTDRHTDRVTTEGTLSGFQDFFPSTYHQGSISKYLSKNYFRILSLPVCVSVCL